MYELVKTMQYDCTQSMHNLHIDFWCAHFQHWHDQKYFFLQKMLMPRLSFTHNDIGKKDLFTIHIFQ